MFFEKYMKSVILPVVVCALIIGLGVCAFFMDGKYSKYDDEPVIDAGNDVWEGKKIIYDGDSICLGFSGGGGYAQLISEQTKSRMENYGVGGARLVTLQDGEDYHSVVDNLKNLPQDGDLYCFQAGINDYWNEGVLGAYDLQDFEGELDQTTVCGALETIFRYIKSINKPVVFVITHKVQKTAFSENSMGDTFEDYHDAMVGICKKYDVPYYDAFENSGLDGSNEQQSKDYLTGNPEGVADGIHPNKEGYIKFYAPQLTAIFEELLK